METTHSQQWQKEMRNNDACETNKLQWRRCLYGLSQPPVPVQRRAISRTAVSVSAMQNFLMLSRFGRFRPTHRRFDDATNAVCFSCIAGSSQSCFADTNPLSRAQIAQLRKKHLKLIEDEDADRLSKKQGLWQEVGQSKYRTVSNNSRLTQLRTCACWSLQQSLALEKNRLAFKTVVLDLFCLFILFYGKPRQARA